MIKYKRKARLNKNEHMWQRNMNITIASRCAEASFSLTRENRAECVGGVGGVHLPGAVAGQVRRRLTSGPPKYMEVPEGVGPPW